MVALAATAAFSVAAGCDRSSAKPQAPAPVISRQRIDQSLAAAQEYLDSQDSAKAIAILITLIDRAPGEVRARELYGQALTRAAEQAELAADQERAAGFRRQAYDQYHAAVAIEPNSAGLRHSAGLMAIAAGRPADALAHFQAAGRLDVKSAQYPLFEAQILIQDRQFDLARAAVDRALRIKADEPVAHASLAMIALELGEFDDALKHIGDARRLDPADVGLRAQEARIYRRSGDPRRCLELLIGLSDEQRGMELVAFEIATAYADLGEHDMSARTWQHCYHTNPNQPKAWLAAVRAGEGFLRAGERELAASWLSQAKRSAPADAPQLTALERAIASSSEVDQ
jgi:tetratricopeptide (TPR) repeat protein